MKDATDVKREGEDGGPISRGEGKFKKTFYCRKRGGRAAEKKTPKFGGGEK